MRILSSAKHSNSICTCASKQMDPNCKTTRKRSSFVMLESPTVVALGKSGSGRRAFSKLRYVRVDGLHHTRSYPIHPDEASSGEAGQ